MPPKNPKPPKPDLRGEKWEPWDHGVVTVLKKLPRGAVQVILPSDRMAVLWFADFKKRAD